MIASSNSTNYWFKCNVSERGYYLAFLPYLVFPSLRSRQYKYNFKNKIGPERVLNIAVVGRKMEIVLREQKARWTAKKRWRLHLNEPFMNDSIDSQTVKFCLYMQERLLRQPARAKDLTDTE